MKRITSILSISVIALMAGCSSDDSQPNGTLSPEVAAYLKVRFGNSRMESLDAASNPAQASFQGMMSNFGLGGGRLSQDSTWEDSIKVDDPYNPWEWSSCAIVTRTENTDGSVTEVYDYGVDGCMEGYEEYQYLMRGKYTQTYKNSYIQEGKAYSDDYLYGVVYDNYGGTYYGDYYENGESSWTMDGFSNYAGSSNWDEETQLFTGNFTYSSETTYAWDNDSYYYKSEGSSIYEGTTFSTDGSYEYRRENDNYFYSVDILQPLVYDNSCVSSQPKDGEAVIALYFFTYVSGIESIQFTEEGKSGAFTIDYGNGACDNLATITENGVSVTVDLSLLYEDEAVLAIEAD